MLEKMSSIFDGITGANTVFNSEYVDTSSSSLFEGVWVSSLKTLWMQYKQNDLFKLHFKYVQHVCITSDPLTKTDERYILIKHLLPSKYLKFIKI